MKANFVVAIGLLLAVEAQTLAADGSPSRGQRVFGACAACHSLQPGANGRRDGGNGRHDGWRTSTTMFVNLKHPLSKGERVNGTLIFERAGKVQIEYSVEGIGAQNASQETNHTHH